MSTRSRIGYVLQDDSILSVYHHWDGYPEGLGVTLASYLDDMKITNGISTVLTTFVVSSFRERKK